jgi:leader peptidase (prepilin peptidase)/N-methyltransferase
VDLVDILVIIFVFFFGLSIGSFITSYTYRAPKGNITLRIRSYCPKCKKNIRWFDNIPIVSYLLLKGKCRNCGNNISKRYPLIEFITAYSFVIIALLAYGCSADPVKDGICQNLSIFGIFTTPFLFAVSSLLIAIFVTDYEHQIILDEMVFLLLVLVFIVVIFYVPSTFFVRVLSGFTASVFLLFLHMITKGKGMGLGDVKLALAGGIILGWPLTLIWISLSFIIGAVVGVLLLLGHRVKFGKQIAFGPFLVLAFFVALIFGESILKIIKF